MASPQVASIDMTDNYAVSVGLVQQSGTKNFWPTSDVEIDRCDGIGCSQKPDWDESGGGKHWGFMFFFD